MKLDIDIEQNKYRSFVDAHLFGYKRGQLLLEKLLWMDEHFYGLPRDYTSILEIDDPSDLKIAIEAYKNNRAFESLDKAQLNIYSLALDHLSKYRDTPVVTVTPSDEKADIFLPRDTYEDGSNKDEFADELDELISKAGYETIDKRNYGGCLWIIESEGTEAFLSSLEQKYHGIKFKYAMYGSSTTDYRCAWYIRPIFTDLSSFEEKTIPVETLFEATPFEDAEYQRLLGHYNSQVDSSIPPDIRERKLVTRKALEELIHLTNNKGYLLSDEVIIIADKYNLSIQETDWVSGEIVLRNIMICDDLPNTN